MIREAIKKVVENANLTEAEAMQVMQEIMSGGTTDAQIGALLAALRMKGETVDEITGFAKVMREKAVRVNVRTGPVVDTCGTGGDGKNTFNVSTTAAFVVAGAGIKVAKHGNKSVSSACGSADILQELGVNINITPEKAGASIDEIGIGFIFAPAFHIAMKHAIGPRKEIGIRSVFNVLGPLTNPAFATAQVVGVYDGRLTTILAHVLKNMGVKHAFVVHGSDGIDEITVSGSTRVSELKGGSVRTYMVTPEKFGLKRWKTGEIKGGDPKENARILISVLEGKKGACRDVVLMNAAAAMVAGGLAKMLKDGITLAEEAINSGKAMKKLNELKEFSNSRQYDS